MLYQDTSAIDAINNGTDSPGWIFIGSNRVAKIKYIRTDAWRGYNEAVATKKHGWQKVKDGWMTGDWSDAPEESQGSNVEAAIEKLAKDNDARGFDTLIVFLPTSNVFSTAYDVFEKQQGSLQTVKRRKLANNTYLIDNGKRRAVRLHSTDIITEVGAGKIRLDSGGWDSMLTRERISKFSSATVYRENGKSYVSGQLFKDGLVVNGSINADAVGRSIGWPRST